LFTDLYEDGEPILCQRTGFSQPFIQCSAAYLNKETRMVSNTQMEKEPGAKENQSDLLSKESEHDTPIDSLPQCHRIPRNTRRASSHNSVDKKATRAGVVACLVVIARFWLTLR
jgi:hypothetical protein